MDKELNINSTLSYLIKKRRESLGSISKATNVPRSTLAEWQSNRSPNPVQAVKVANYLGVSLHYLLFGEDDREEPLQKVMKEDFFKGTFEISIKRIRSDD